MAGIYFHIPFCKSRCSYCDFYKSTDTSKIKDLVRALQLELKLQIDYLNDKTINTIYFGGGTPSLLSADQIKLLITACKEHFDVDPLAEITMEANPDDLNFSYLESIQNTGVNRLSIGIQSLSSSDLKLMHRRHNVNQGIEAVCDAQKAGFHNISVDLIYGIPNMSFEQWKENLKMVFEMNIQHLSAYHLTYHKKTKMWNDLQKGLVHEIDEKESVKQFEALIAAAKENGFIHYEISNFAPKGFFSRHNSAYWKQVEYLGLGPSAHSFNTQSRQWNISSLSRYLLKMKANEVPFEREKLSIKDRFNDYMITSIRTIWGIDRNYVLNEFGEQYSKHVKLQAEKYQTLNQMVITPDRVQLAEKGMFVSDLIMSDFML